MKFFHTIVLVGWVLLGLVPGVGAQFDDVGESRYPGSIHGLAEQGVLVGYGDGTVRPLAEVNRAEFLKVVLEASEVEVLNRSDCFTDVSRQWFAPYVCTAREMGLVEGYADGSFGPERPVLMVEAVKMVATVMELPVEFGEESRWYMPYVEYFHKEGVLSQYSYHMDRPARREEMAHLVWWVVAEEEQRPLHFRYSAGCGIAPPATTPQRFMVGDQEREAIVVIPSGYNPTTPVPLVMAFHGRTNGNAQVQRYYGLERRGAMDHAIIVYPAGQSVGASSYTWAGSYGFVDVVLETLQEQYCVDLDQLYAVGHSLGAYMANDVACTHGDRFRGVGSLGGGMTERHCAGPVASMVLHNPKDRLVAFVEGQRARDVWRDQNGGGHETVPVGPDWGNCVEYDRGHPTAPVWWCAHGVDYERSGVFYPHTWPQDTGRAMAEFLKGLEG